MSGTHAAAGSSDFTELWRNVSKVCRTKPGQQIPDTAASPICNDLQSPNRTGCGRYFGLNNADSPCDAEASQDIIWDSTSPTQANAGSGFRNRVVEISDIVNRIAPKDVKGKGTDSPLLQWIGDSAVPCTPEIAKPRLRKRSCRQNSVEDLMKLAKQFDENMQQDKESSEQLNTLNNNLNECVNTSQTKATHTSFHSSAKGPSPSDPVEKELHALFDCSTQKISGHFSQGSSASACSQEIKYLPGTSQLAEPQQSWLKPTDKSSLAAPPAEQKGCDDFDDDWENDDLINDSFILAMTQNPDQQPNTNPETTCKPTAGTHSTHQPSDLHSKPNCSALQELCPKPKTTNRSTFKIEPNPCFKPQTAAKDVSKPNFTVVQAKTQMSDRRTARPKTLATPQPLNYQRRACVAEGSSKHISDSLWDDGEDDALLYQVCDTVERLSNSQPQQASSSNCQERRDINVNRQQKNTVPLTIDTAWTVRPGARQSSQEFVQSNSLPSTSCENVNYQGWNVPMKGANNKSWMSQSLPGNHVSLGTFGQCKESSGTFHDSGGDHVDTKPRTVTASLTPNPKSHHTAFKRNVSDSAINNKVFVTNERTGKCSAAEIERKKQEALARKRLRMQNASKP